MKVEPNHLLKALRSAVEAINDMFNPTERLEKQIVELDRKIARSFALLVPLQANVQSHKGADFRR